MEQIKRLLFAMTKQERETMREKYKTKIPEPLTSQFPERASKDTATNRVVSLRYNICQHLHKNKKPYRFSWNYIQGLLLKIL